MTKVLGPVKHHCIYEFAPSIYNCLFAKTGFGGIDPRGRLLASCFLLMNWNPFERYIKYTLEASSKIILRNS